MPDELVFYTSPMSRGRIVRWMLEEVGAPYRTELMNFGDKMKSPEYLAINPMGKVPALTHGDRVVTECGAICAYLADAFPEAGLAPPPKSKDRAPYYRWLFYAAGPVEATFTNKSLGFVAPPERAGMLGYGSFEAVEAVLNDVAGGCEYLVGNRFSAADVYFGSEIGFMLRFGNLQPTPALTAYWDRLESRPAHVRARAIDDALIAQNQAAAPA